MCVYGINNTKVEDEEEEEEEVVKVSGEGNEEREVIRVWYLCWGSLTYTKFCEDFKSFSAEKEKKDSLHAAMFMYNLT